MFVDEPTRVPHPGARLSARQGGCVRCLPSPFSFYPVISAVLDAHSSVPASLSADSPLNSAVFVSHAAVSQLTCFQSSSRITTEIESNTAASVTKAAASHLTGSQPHACCRTRQHHRTPTESITIPQRGGGGGEGG
jgi:hypothetical protein